MQKFSINLPKIVKVTKKSYRRTFFYHGHINPSLYILIKRLNFDLLCNSNSNRGLRKKGSYLKDMIFFK